MDAQGAGRWRTAAGSWLRASNYARTAEFFLHIDPADPRITSTSRRAVDAFRAFARMHPGHDDLAGAVPLTDRNPVFPAMRMSEVTIPFGDAHLPGWWMTPGDDHDAVRPTLLALGGFDSIAEEMYFTVGKTAVEQGWNVLLFDGPGQGRVIREQGVHFRPDYEAPVSAVVDAVLGFPVVDADRIALIGMSQGGYFAARAAAFEPRLAALVVWDGIYDVSSANAALATPEILEHIAAGRDDRADELIRSAARDLPSLAWVVAKGTWTYGVDSPAEYFRRNEQYTLADGVAERIACPTLVIDAEADHSFRGQPQVFADHLLAPHTLLRMSEADGAGEHCNAGSVNRFQEALFDWLDATV
ncbi:dipeptidyl aminopeptidase [Curtobacterium sp. SGAir0471]|uniref:alpha/beta hydrolase family protein n=1 Tax=Curtobacterium sp. SGAir0471 TaxID=2070337 RepID=UPI0010CD6081|nr:acetylxylan esterase [Curtobacterium sp. SGAir0471]QCR43470.1 dipeptidyl aminopeptidase [Curtobacterium sp. SGAir0471]